MKDFIKYYWPSIIWAAFVLVICLLPPSNLPKSKIPNLDKLVHFSSYAVMAFLLAYSVKKQNSIPVHLRNYLFILAFSAAYGFIIEILQSYVGREFSWWDELTNIVGAIAGCILSRIIWTRKNTWY